jgi:hypothetical protein
MPMSVRSRPSTFAPDGRSVLSLPDQTTSNTCRHACFRAGLSGQLSARTSGRSSTRHERPRLVTNGVRRQNAKLPRHSGHGSSELRCSASDRSQENPGSNLFSQVRAWQVRSWQFVLGSSFLAVSLFGFVGTEHLRYRSNRLARIEVHHPNTGCFTTL